MRIDDGKQRGSFWIHIVGWPDQRVFARGLNFRMLIYENKTMHEMGELCIAGNASL